MGGFGLTRLRWPNYNTGTGPITINTAATVAQNYVAAIGNPDLKVTQVEEYANNFYVQVNEKSTATEPLNYSSTSTQEASIRRWVPT